VSYHCQSAVDVRFRVSQKRKSNRMCWGEIAISVNFVLKHSISQHITTMV